MDEYTDFSQADKELCRKAREAWHFGKYVSDGHADMMAVLRSGYPMHGSWGAKAADTIERLTKELDLSLKVEKSAVHTAAEMITERDAALAEVERLRSELEIEARRPINLMGNQG